MELCKKVRVGEGGGGGVGKGSGEGEWRSVGWRIKVVTLVCTFIPRPCTVGNVFFLPRM